MSKEGKPPALISEDDRKHKLTRWLVEGFDSAIAMNSGSLCELEPKPVHTFITQSPDM